MTVCCLVKNTSGVFPLDVALGFLSKIVSRYWELTFKNGDGLEGWGCGKSTGGKKAGCSTRI